jgi:effector-binding domain-containing protein
MSWQDLGIEYKRVPETVAASIRINLHSRQELPAILQELAQRIPGEQMAGPPFCVIRFVTSVEDGFDAEIGFPVIGAVKAGDVGTHASPPMDVLSLMHTGPLEALGESYRTLYAATAEQGLISDEFAREVYPDWELAEWNRVEVQFVVHNWDGLFAANLDRVLGEAARSQVMRWVDEPRIECTLDERFRWAKEMVERLQRSTSEDQVYDVLSGCAHVFPQEQIDKLRAVYLEALTLSDDPVDAVDAVIAFMGRDPGWAEPPLREGGVIYATKAPRDRQAYERAESEMERRSAYCFCPIVRNRLEQGMPPTFCYCGAGWYRQQWEGAIGEAVSMRIVKSILNGDDGCQFAIVLPDGL